MKKTFMILSVSLLAMLAIAGCSKNDGTTTQTNQKGQTDSGKKEEQKEDEVFTMDIKIDGKFEDWDVLTTETADDYHVFVSNTDADKNALLRLKLTSDEDVIYVYTELNYEYLFLADGPLQLGNSNDGFKPTHPGTPGPLWVWVDGDGNKNQNFSTHLDSETGAPYFNTNGFDIPAQYYFAFSKADNKVVLGWQQVNYMPDGIEPGGVYNDGWWASGITPAGGWDPDTDNLITTSNLIAFSAPTTLVDPVTNTKVSGIKIEFAMDRSQMEGLTADTVYIGVNYQNRDNTASFGDTSWTGQLPSTSGVAPLTLKLY